MKFSMYRQYFKEPRPESDTSDHAGANCLGGFDC